MLQQTVLLFAMGEISADCYVDIPSVVRKTVQEIGYTKPEYGFDYRTCAVVTTIDEQSPDIAMGVNESYEYKNVGKDPDDLIGAGDQGIMFGFACDETPELMPAPISMAHKLTRKLAEVRKTGILPWVRPDGKAQVSIEYGANNEILRCEAIVLSTQHDPDIELEDIRREITQKVIMEVIPNELIDKNTKIYVNPSEGLHGGPVGDSGHAAENYSRHLWAYRHEAGLFRKDPSATEACLHGALHCENVVAAGYQKDVKWKLRMHLLPVLFPST